MSEPTTDFEADALRARFNAGAPRISVDPAQVRSRAERRIRATRWGRSVAAAACVAVVAFGASWIGPRLSETPDRSTVAVAPDGDADPGALVGVWQVTDAPSLDGEAWLRLDPGRLELWTACGSVSGPWDATGAAFLATINGNDECLQQWDTYRAWVESIAEYRPSGDAWDLYDASGNRIAHLSDGGTPTVSNSPSLTEEPTASPGDLSLLAAQDPIPAGFTPASPDHLIGRWVAATDPQSGYPYAEFTADGRWSATDGCHDNSGRWAIDANGTLLLTQHPQLDYGCADLPDYEPVLRWIQLSSWLAAEGQELIAVDSDGVELGRLVRDAARREPIPVAGATLPEPSRLVVRTACTRGSLVHVFEETATEVRVELTAPRPLDQTEGLVCNEIHVLNLERPLGERALIDLHSGEAITVDTAP